VRALGFLLLLAAAAAAQEQQAAAELFAGRQAFEAGRFEEALACFTRAEALAPLDWRGGAYRSLTLVQLAMGQPDLRKREVLLRDAERVAGDLVRRELVEFHDPLYRFVRGLIYSIAGDDMKAYAVLDEALRAPREKFAPYDEIELHRMVRRAFAVAATRVARHMITVGHFEKAEVELERADKGLAADDPERQLLERLFAAVSENLGKLDKAIEHLRKCIELSKRDPVAVEELTATIALIHLVHEELDKGRAVLAELPADSQQPDVVAARCTLAMKDALRDRGERLDEGLAYVKNVMRSYPPENAYKLVLIYRTLLDARVGPREAQTPEGRALLEEAIPIYKREIDRRPECPPLYFALYRIYKLLGNAEEERRYQDLHERKKKDFEHQEKYDQRGWPRCGT
jgi:tetratricopeptide (TPR) repeat protein